MNKGAQARQHRLFVGVVDWRQQDVRGGDPGSPKSCILVATRDEPCSLAIGIAGFKTTLDRRRLVDPPVNAKILVDLA